MKSVESDALLQSLSKLWEGCPEMRLGQLMATLGLLAEDTTEHSLWDVENEELLTVMERLREDLCRRHQIDSTGAENGSSG